MKAKSACGESGSYRSSGKYISLLAGQLCLSSFLFVEGCMCKTTIYVVIAFKLRNIYLFHQLFNGGTSIVKALSLRFCEIVDLRQSFSCVR